MGSALLLIVVRFAVGSHDLSRPSTSVPDIGPHYYYYVVDKLAEILSALDQSRLPSFCLRGRHRREPLWQDA
ncbi:hypothetical protein ZTR_10926 [Talaromyces verruculosus]|nr:hypothetical protein ZTR_10926 [Talaromyces verruculosus]